MSKKILPDTVKEWESFGYNTDKPCDICGNTPAKLEPRFGYPTCRACAHISPAEREEIKETLKRRAKVVEEMLEKDLNDIFVGRPYSKEELKLLEDFIHLYLEALMLKGVVKGVEVDTVGAPTDTTKQDEPVKVNIKFRL